MNRPIVYRQAAREEFDEAFDWYEQQRAGLGVTFANRVQNVLDSIAAAPEAHAIVFQDIRRAVVPKFPYSVFYRVEPNQIVILAIFHGKRDPRIWQSRV